MNKKILMLGGSYAQIPIIKEAKEQGLYVITCDYLPDNPGHKLADKYFNISTTEIEAVKKLAEKIKPDFVIAYASDPAAPVAAFVSEKLGLPGNSYKSVRILSEKDLFRDFLRSNGFNTPKSIGFSENEVKTEKIRSFSFPLILKPTDSSGSKGVIKIRNINEFDNAVKYALQYSRKKRIVVEEFIDTHGKQLHGDGYVINGQLVFCYLGDHHYNNNVNPFVPYSTTWPSQESEFYLNSIQNDVQRILSILNFKNGGINIEARIYNDKIYIMEIGPRNGGNFVPQVLKLITNFDMVEASINNLLGKEIDLSNINKGFGAYYVIHSAIDGILKDIYVDDIVKKHIKESHYYIKTNDSVKSFQGSNAAIGVLLLQFTDKIEMDHIINNIHKYIKVGLK